ncbi:TetR/AcrR family transcriptional regulator [Hyphobacterium indicum]|uniref:TetR/AcrR family transcriptional regulator n=1 Tax=Hyphobacterium indicum TaxID=2162714 RepID=UPI000D65B22D|nr:TetR/AcrR family transcriptional regulator [Hyphobacterium indicum]
MDTYLDKTLLDRGPADQGITGQPGSTKARIERAALKLFAARGVDGVSIKDIASACDISDGAMYRHFKSKESLAHTLFQAIHARLLGMLREKAAPDAGLEATVRTVVTAYCELAEQDPAAFAYHLTARNTVLARAGDGGADPSSLMAQRVAAAITAGEIPAGDPELKSAMALGVVLQAAEYRLYGRITTPLTNLIEVFTRSVLAVLRTEG